MFFFFYETVIQNKSKKKPNTAFILPTPLECDQCYFSERIRQGYIALEPSGPGPGLAVQSVQGIVGSTVAAILSAGERTRKLYSESLFVFFFF